MFYSINLLIKVKEMNRHLFYSRSRFTVPMPHIPAVEFQSSKGIVHVRKRDESLACWFARGDVYTILSYVESYKVIQSQKIDKNVIQFPP